MGVCPKRVGKGQAHRCEIKIVQKRLSQDDMELVKVINANGNAEFMHAIAIIKSPAPIIGMVFVVDSVVVGFSPAACAVLRDLKARAKKEIYGGVLEGVKLIIHAVFRPSAP